MATLQDWEKKYLKKVAPLDRELIFSLVLKKPREFILTHPDFPISDSQGKRIGRLINRRIKKEPLAYILGHKEFFGLEFKTTKNVLIPRPETELLAEKVLEALRNLLHNSSRDTIIIDVGTGSGNIIVSIAEQLKKNEFRTMSYELIGIDLSTKALAIAKQNAKKHIVDKKLKLLKGDLLSPLLKNSKFNPSQRTKLIILANLPYLSLKNYSGAPKDVKNYEPKNALFSKNKGLAHYIKLLKQVRSLIAVHPVSLTLFLEISPEQKPQLSALIKKWLPRSTSSFFKDLSDRWRLCQIEII